MYFFITIALCCIYFVPVLVLAIQEGVNVNDSSTYPYYVMLGNPHVCGGIIISFNPPIVLTAAHCVADVEHPLNMTQNPYFVGYGDIDRKHHTINPIVDWLVHPDYLKDQGEVDMHHDIAIVKLQKPLKPSARIARVALWSAKDLDVPRQAMLMGYGYTRVDQPEARILQHMPVNITKFTAGYSDMVEAMSSHSDERACHGDSGSPLIVQKQVNNGTSLPVAVGLLARIFGVYDHDPSHATCPVPFDTESKAPTIIESFCNLSNMLKWIADETGITVEQLVDPLFEPNSTCYDECLGRWKGTRPEEIDEDEKSSKQWNIGFGDSIFEKNHPDKWWIGPLVQQESLFTSDSSSTTILTPIRHFPFFFITIIAFVVTCSISKIMYIF
ncbi:trypsin-like cysteine/serine peptidase domain-containing protein [Phascolomyces articulosus]|uniref:Trypsin-like cysteine/serine peptidase domain-containing protein n=1 Tax=Phascolomyces articulosus TaxID=60185 RepID=A0AAD5P8C0_9FUNG|nr:trypsin-like cysteine/serine peptidase domain-containing protein [Phascolomyces articulosus]